MTTTLPPVTTTIFPTPLSRRIVLVARDIKLSHSIFALPFALLGTFIAAAYAHRRPSFIELLLIIICMFFARTVAMTVNRWADRFIDIANPRTAVRAIPSGELSDRSMLTAAIVCAFSFIAASSGFWAFRGNAWPMVLSPLVLAWLCLYSFTKRFTWLCHLFLGGALATSPLAAGLAIEPSSLSHVGLYLLAASVVAWVAGFDIIYALQDVEIDRKLGLFSMPSRLGISNALWISRALHLFSFMCMIVLWRQSSNLGIGFALGLVIVAALLMLEHLLIHLSAKKHLNMAFFTVNGIISLLLGTLGIIDILRLS